jgi:ribosome-associated heat shock protein Hsp15
MVDMYRAYDTPASRSTSGVIEIIKATLSKNGTGRPTKDRRDIDEFGNEIKNRREDN